MAGIQRYLLKHKIGMNENDPNENQMKTGDFQKPGCFKRCSETTLHC